MAKITNEARLVEIDAELGAVLEGTLDTEAWDTVKKLGEERAALLNVSKDDDEDELAALQEQLSFSERERIVSHAFRQKFNPPQTGGFEDRIPFDQRPWVREVYEDFLLVAIGPIKYRVNYTMDAQQNVTLDERSDWKKAELEVVVVESESAVTELDGSLGDTSLIEHGPLMLHNLTENEGGVQEADIVLMQPGWGNPKDKHYYPAEVLKRDSSLFEGVPMFATNHKLDEQTPRNRVATIIESGKRFMESGAPIARIAVQKGWFWNDLKLLNKYGLLHTVHNSIMALGKSVQGSVQGKVGNIVQEITEPRSVDFVNRAGAGGHVLSLVEGMLGAGDTAILSADYVLEKRPDIVTAVLLSEQNKLMAQIQENRERTEKELKAAKSLRSKFMSNNERNEQGQEGEANLQELQAQTTLLLAKTGKLTKAFNILLLSEDFTDLVAMSRARVFTALIEADLTEVADDKFEEHITGFITEEVDYVKQLIDATNANANGSATNVKGNGGRLQEDGGEEEVVDEKTRIKAVDEIMEKYSAV